MGMSPQLLTSVGTLLLYLTWHLKTTSYFCVVPIENLEDREEDC